MIQWMAQMISRLSDSNRPALNTESVSQGMLTPAHRCSCQHPQPVRGRGRTHYLHGRAPCWVCSHGMWHGKRSAATLVVRQTQRHRTTFIFHVFVSASLQLPARCYLLTVTGNKIIHTCLSSATSTVQTCSYRPRKSRPPILSHFCLDFLTFIIMAIATLTGYINILSC